MKRANLITANEHGENSMRIQSDRLNKNNFRITTMKIILMLTVFLTGTAAIAQNRLYTEGSVWNVSFIKTIPGMGQDYLNNLKTTWKAVHDEALKQGLILSYKILDGEAANPQDFDILLLVEYKNLASMEGQDDKWDAIYKKSIGDEATMKQLRENRVSMRTIYGGKLMREIVYK
jgi:hypothetical protein